MTELSDVVPPSFSVQQRRRKQPRPAPAPAFAPHGAALLAPQGRTTLLAPGFAPHGKEAVLALQSSASAPRLAAEPSAAEERRRASAGAAAVGLAHAGLHSAAAAVHREPQVRQRVSQRLRERERTPFGGLAQRHEIGMGRGRWRCLRCAALQRAPGAHRVVDHQCGRRDGRRLVGDAAVRVRAAQRRASRAQKSTFF